MTRGASQALAQGNAFLHAGKPRAASEAFETAIGLQPDAPDAHRALAALAMQHGGTERCLPVLERAARLAPGDGWAHRETGRVLCTLGRFAQAVAPLRQAVRLGRPDAALLFDLGVALQESAALPDAIAAYRAALAIAPDVRARHNLASALQSTGDMAGALQNYALAFALDPSCLPRIAQDLAAGRCGRVFLSRERLEQALRAA